MVSRRHIEGPETVARGSRYHPKMVPTGSLEHTHTYIYIYVRSLKWSRGSWAVSRLYLEGTLGVTGRSPEGLYIAQRWSPLGIYNTHTIYIVSRRHIAGPETVARWSRYHPKMVPTGSLEHTHIHIYIDIDMYIYIYIYI